MHPRTLLDTANPQDALLLGYDVASEPGEGLSLTCEHVFNGAELWFTLRGPDGEIELTQDAAREIAEQILKQLRFRSAQRHHETAGVAA